MYTQAEFRAELAHMKVTLELDNPGMLMSTANRARALLGAGGEVGSVITGANRHELQTVLDSCESALAAHSTPASQAVPDAGQVDAGSVN